MYLIWRGIIEMTLYLELNVVSLQIKISRDYNYMMCFQDLLQSLNIYDMLCVILFSHIYEICHMLWFWIYFRSSFRFVKDILSSIFVVVCFSSLHRCCFIVVVFRYPSPPYLIIIINIICYAFIFNLNN